jgi:hypothetical protein
MSFRADLAIHSPDGHLIALVEVKNIERFDHAAALGIRQNLTTYSSLPEAPYLLLVSQDQGYLWSSQPDQTSDSTPMIEFSMQPVMQRYYANGANLQRMSGSQLEYVVFQWLTELAWSRESSIESQAVPLHDSVFAEAIRGGRVLMEAIV